MSKQKKITITPTLMRRHDDELVKKSLVLMCACLMDEDGFTKEQICDFAKRFERYNNAIDQHIISIKQVREIISQEIDLEMVFN